LKHSDTEDLASGAAQIVASAVPLLGGPIAAGIAAWEGRRVSKRIEALVGEIATLAKQIDQGKLDKTYIQTDEFQDAVIAALDVGRRTADAGKRRIIAAILLGAAFTEKPQQLDVEALLDTIGNLSPQDLALARHLYDESGRDEPKAIVTGVVGPVDFPDREFHLKRLEAGGLINEKTGATYGYQGGEYFMTMTFHRLMALLKLTGT
jgi:uncharacterized heparinase superfamily protein